jgi:thioredoxin 1
MVPFKDLIQSEKPVLVDFYADWCMPCKSMEPIIKEVAKTTEGKTKIIKINIDKNTETAQNYEVQAVPTFILFKKGKIVWRHPGMIDKASLLSVLAKNA